MKGVRPVIYEHTAWDLALATQALSYLKPDLAFDISKVYTQQNAFQTGGKQRGVSLAGFCKFPVSAFLSRQLVTS